MKYRIKGLIRSCAHRLGLELSRYVPLAAALNTNGITTVFDIGANQGQFGGELRRDGYQGKIVSFEPIASAYSRLLRRSKGYRDWRVHARCAVGAQDSPITINLSKNSGSSSILPILAEHTSAAPDSVYIGQETVQQVRFDGVFRDYIGAGERFFMKIDTQGYEQQVMAGAAQALQLVQGLQLEVSFFALYERQPSYKYFLDWAEASGFSLWSVHDGFSNPGSGKTLQADICFFRA